MQCLSCFNAQLSNCSEGITVNGGFAVGSSYKWVITDSFGNKYSGIETATEDGIFIADDAEGLPSGFFNPYAGDFLLNFFEDPSGKPFTVGICREYECINVHIQKNDPDVIETEIGNCDSGGGGCCGIDDVLAIAQLFTADRSIDINGKVFSINSNVDNAAFSNKLTITGGDNTEIANLGTVGFLKSQNAGGIQYGIVAVDKTKVAFGQSEGSYQFQNLVQQTDPVTYKPLSVDSLGNVFEMDDWPGGATPTWQQVLDQGNTATDTVYGSIVTTDLQNINFVRPINYNNTTIGEYTSWLDSTFVNPSSGRKDVVYSWHAYNWLVGGGAKLAGEAAYAFKAEQFYEADTTELFEFHLPEIVDNAGTAHRLFSMYSHRPDGYTYLQSQVGSLSFRPNYDNTGASEWLGMGGGGYVGAAQIRLDSSLGTGGVTGDQSNYVRFQMFDGTGNAYTLFGSGGGFSLITPGESIFNTGFLHLSRYIRFDQAAYFGEGATFELGEVASDNNGYKFYDFAQNTLFANFYKNYSAVWTSWHVIGNAQFGNLVLGTITDPTNTDNGKIWSDGTDFFTYQTTVKKKFLLQGNAANTVSNSDGTLTISPTSGNVVASLNLAHANTWTGQQTFNTIAPIFGTMTAGSVFFAGAGGLLSQANANFSWDNSAKTLTIAQAGTANTVLSSIFASNTGTSTSGNQMYGGAYYSSGSSFSSSSKSNIVRFYNKSAGGMSQVASFTVEASLNGGAYAQIFKADTTATNGAITVGQISADLAGFTALIAGPNSATVAGFRLNSSTLLATPAIGAIEYDGTHFYGTVTGPARLQLDRQYDARNIFTTSPLAGGGDLSADRTLSIANAAADGATKGAATFLAADFNDNAAGLISIDYTNGQAATTSLKGFLTSTDWNTFNGKESVLTFTTPGNTRSGNTITNDLITGKSGGLTAVGGTASGNSLTLQSTTNATRGKINFGSAATTYWDEANSTFKIAGAGVSATPTLDVSATYSTTGFPLQVKSSGYYHGYFQGTSSLNQVAFLFENERGSFLSYGTFFIGGSACNLGNVMGIGRADKFFVCADGTNNLGMVIGTLNAQPLIFGSSNLERARLLSSGQLAVGQQGGGNAMLSVKAGNQTTYIARVGGTIGYAFADVGNTTTAETDLHTDTYPANIFGFNGDEFRAQWAGVTVAHASDTRRIRVYLAGNVIMDTGAKITATASAWRVFVSIVRDTTTTARCGCSLIDINGSLLATSAYTLVTGLTFTNTNIIKITGQSSNATNDIVLKFAKIEFINS